MLGNLRTSSEVAVLCGVRVPVLRYWVRVGHLQTPRVRFGWSFGWSPDEVRAAQRYSQEHGRPRRPKPTPAEV
jgi:hypothetical protein